MIQGPFCQVSSEPTPLTQVLRNPPAYTPATASISPPSYTDELPAYNSLVSQHTLPPEKSGTNSTPAEDVLHFLDHSTDTLPSLSLRYGVPITALKRKNGITADHLLLARRTILIPGEFYNGGVSLSPRPIEGEEEELRKSKLRRFMLATKVSEYVRLCLSQQSSSCRYQVVG